MRAREWEADQRAHARRLVQIAVAKGTLTRPDSCQRCGGSPPPASRRDGSARYPIQGHHEDYSKPLEVIWLCTPCHKLIHADDPRQPAPDDRGPVDLSDLAGQVFADVPQVADILGRDERTVRRAIEAGSIPAKKVGSKWAVPVSWLREQAGVPEPSPDVDELADAVADRVVARLARLLAAGMMPGSTAL